MNLSNRYLVIHPGYNFHWTWAFLRIQRKGRGEIYSLSCSAAKKQPKETKRHISWKRFFPPWFCWTLFVVRQRCQSEMSQTSLGKLLRHANQVGFIYTSPKHSNRNFWEQKGSTRYQYQQQIFQRKIPFHPKKPISPIFLWSRRLEHFLWKIGVSPKTPHIKLISSASSPWKPIKKLQWFPCQRRFRGRKFLIPTAFSV